MCIIEWTRRQCENPQQITSDLFDSYWRQNQDIGDINILLDLADEAGLNLMKARAVLDDPDDVSSILDEANAFREAGVEAVPTFIVNEKQGFSGALPPARLAESFEQLFDLTSA